MASTTLFDGMYYEITYNGDKQRTLFGCLQKVGKTSALKLRRGDYPLSGVNIFLTILSACRDYMRNNHFGHIAYKRNGRSDNKDEGKKGMVSF